MAITRVLVAPLAECRSINCGALVTASRRVWIDEVGQIIQDGANRLMGLFNLEPGSGKELPEAVQKHKGINPGIKAAMKKMLGVGAWSPRVLPFSQGPREGFTLVERMYSRFFIMNFSPSKLEMEPKQDEQLLESGLPICYWHPKTLAALKDEEMPEGDKTIMDVVRSLRDRITSSKGNRITVKSGNIGKPVFQLREDITELDPAWAAWHKVNFATDMLYDGLEIPVEAIQGTREAEFEEFKWLQKNPESVIMIEGGCLGKVRPKFNFSVKNLPESVRKSDPIFLDEEL